jgi:hypothetical protein
MIVFFVDLFFVDLLNADDADFGGLRRLAASGAASLRSIVHYSLFIVLTACR